MSDTVKYHLDESRIPKVWYNIAADLPKKVSITPWMLPSCTPRPIRTSPTRSPRRSARRMTCSSPISRVCARGIGWPAAPGAFTFRDASLRSALKMKAYLKMPPSSS